MRHQIISVCMAVWALAGITAAQSQIQTWTLIINGRSGKAAVVQMDGREFIDLHDLARVAHGSVSFQAEQIILTLPSSAENTVQATPATDRPTSTGFSGEFMKAGIEEIALMREWVSPLAYAIQNGYPITEQWVAGYREQAAHGLSLASIAAKTDADKSALRLLTNEFEAVREWSDKLVQARKSLSATNYAISANALRNDPLSQKIVSCGHFLGTMLGSGSFQDDSSCH